MLNPNEVQSSRAEEKFPANNPVKLSRGSIKLDFKVTLFEKYAVSSRNNIPAPMQSEAY